MLHSDTNDYNINVQIDLEGSLFRFKDGSKQTILNYSSG